MRNGEERSAHFMHAPARPDAAPAAAAVASPSSLVLANSRLRLVLAVDDGKIAPARIETADGTPWADASGELLFDFRSADGATLRARALRLLDHSTRETPAGLELRIETEALPPAPATRATTDASAVHGLRVNLLYVLAHDDAVLTEQLELVARTPGPRPLRLHRASFGWRLAARAGLSWLPIPFGDSAGSSAPTLLTDAAPSRSGARDGAALHDSARNEGFLVAKTPTDRDPEFIVVKSDRAGLAFSGFSPEPSVNDCNRWLESGRHLSSPTRFELVSGPIERVFLAHRSFMDAHGIGPPAHYAPPLNYCVYYECKNEWTAAQIETLLPVAASLGCTLLYTDQGWETGFGSGLWDEARLGACADFVAKARRVGLEVGVLVSLHSSPAGATAWGPECFRRTAYGTIEDGDRWHSFGLCPQSTKWREEKTRRLARLAADGVKFFSFDFNDAKDYAGPGFRHYLCHSREHEHPGVQSAWEHVSAVARQQREFRALAPEALVEAHDWALSADAAHPGYLFPASAQERWGFEYMWSPFKDFRKGHLQNLAWFNLAYSRPLYLHIDLLHDHPELLTAFWFLASTVRHIGIGNFTALDAARQERVRAALRLYLAHREFFTHGTFFADGTCVHLHVLKGRGAVAMLFNETDATRTVSGELPASDLAGSGLSDSAAPRLETWLGPAIAHTRTASGAHRFSVELPAWGVAAATLA